jgi:hypothetical protein
VCVSAGTVNSAPGGADVILDATGYVPAGSSPQLALLAQPRRLLDTRAGGGPTMTAASRCLGADCHARRCTVRSHRSNRGDVLGCGYLGSRRVGARGNGRALAGDCAPNQVQNRPTTPSTGRPAWRRSDPPGAAAPTPATTTEHNEVMSRFPVPAFWKSAVLFFHRD